MFTLILSLKSTREKENPCKSCPATEHKGFKKIKGFLCKQSCPSSNFILFNFILICSEDMKANHFHASSPCILWEHPPHLRGKHTLLPRHKEIKYLGYRAPYSVPAPVPRKLQGSFTPQHGFEPAHSWSGGSCPLLTVLQPVCLLHLLGGEAPAVIPGSPCASHPPQIIFKGVPSQDGVGEREGCDTAGALTWPLQEQPAPSSDRSPLGSQQDKSCSTSSAGQASEPSWCVLGVLTPHPSLDIPGQEQSLACQLPQRLHSKMTFLLSENSHSSSHQSPPSLQLIPRAAEGRAQGFHPTSEQHRWTLHGVKLADLDGLLKRALPRAK